MDIEKIIAAKAHDLAARNIAKATAMFGYQPPAQNSAHAAPRPVAPSGSDLAAQAAAASARIVEIEAELAAINTRAAAESKAAWDRVIAKQNTKRKRVSATSDDKPKSGWAKVIDRFNRQGNR